MNMRNFFIVLIIMVTVLLLFLPYLRQALAYTLEEDFREEDWENFEGEESDLAIDSPFRRNDNSDVNEPNDRDEAELMGKVYLEPEFLDGDILKISAMAGEMQSPILGFSFYLNYENAKLAFLRYEPGDFLERGGDPFYLVKNQASKIIFGETLRRNDSFPVDSGKIVDFYFQILEKEALNFEFEKAVVSTLDTVRQDLANVEWENLSLDEKGEKIGREIVDSQSEMQPLGETNVQRINFSNSWMLMVGIGSGMMGMLVIFIIMKKFKSRRKSSFYNTEKSRQFFN